LALGLATGVLLALSLSSALLVPTALAAGGTSIASAPQLPVGTTVTGGASAHTEFWRVTMAASDKLTIDFQPVNGGSVYLSVYRPGVTDYTLGDSSSVAWGDTSSRSQFTWTATGQGAWILEVYSNHGYRLRPTVRARTATKLSAPRNVHSGAWFYYRGSVSPSVSRGTVLLQRFVKKSWRTFSTVNIGQKGKFSRRARFVSKAPHQEKVRAYYRGDASHLASLATVRILVQ
jgi:hypothetical protein